MKSLFLASQGDSLRSRRRKTQCSALPAMVERLEPRRVLSVSIVVNTATDPSTPTAGITSLREAISQANGETGDVITFDSSLKGQTIQLTQLELDVTSSMTIQGLGANQLTIDAQGQSCVFIVGDPSTTTNVTISGLNLINSGNAGTLAGTLQSDGSAILNLANLTLTNNSISGGTALEGGALLNSPSGTVTSSGNTISGNHAIFGGGIFNLGTVNSTNDTIFGNSEVGTTPHPPLFRPYTGGGGVYNGTGATMTLSNDTITANSATQATAGGVENDGTLSMFNTIVSGNTALLSPVNVEGFTDSPSNHNLIDAAVATLFVTDGSGNPLLASSLGTTQTVALKVGSMAIDAGSNGLISAGINFDATGQPRIVNGTVDLGAVESYYTNTTLTTVSPSLSSPAFGQSVSFTAGVANSGTGTVAPQGTVQFLLDGAAFGTPVTLDATGQATSASISTLAAVGHTVSASYTPSAAFIASSSGNLGFTVSPASSTLAISAPTINYGAHGLVTVTVSSAAGTPTGNVTLSVDGGADISLALTNGVATFDLGTSLSAGSHSLSANYSAQGNFSGSGIANVSFTVSRASTSVAISSPTINAGAHGLVTVTVSSAAGTPTGNVTLSVDGGAAISLALTNGVATFDLGTALPAGSHTLSANYAVQGNFAASSHTGTLVVNAMTKTTFSTFSTNLTGGKGQFQLSANIKLGNGSKGISPLTESFTLVVGSTTIILPPGSFHVGRRSGRFIFKGTVNGIDLKVTLKPQGNGQYTLTVDAQGNAIRVTKPTASVSLTIGNDTGTVTTRVN